MRGELDKMIWKAKKGWVTKVPVEIDGEIMKVERGADFVKTIGTLTDNVGWSVYRVFIDGNEIDPDDAPDDFDGIDSVKITKQDEAAGRT